MKRAILILAILALAGPSPADAPPESSAPGDDRVSITLKWSATNEKSVYGYLVYRAERRQGPFLRINPEIIHRTGPGDETTVNSYVYTDDTVRPEITYFYSLDTISKEGRKERFSGVIKRTAPAPPAAESDAP